MAEHVPPMIFTWDGESLLPLRPALADRHLVVGEKYRMGVIEERSGISHRHYFVSVREAWKNLPEDLALRFPTDVHLRKWCLIKAGYRDERSIVCASRAEALRLASFIKPMDEFAVVTVSEAVVTVYTAKSQSLKAMGKKVFQESKQAVLEILADMIQVTPAELQRNAGMAA